MTDAHKTKPQGRDELTASRHWMGDAGADWRGVSDFQKARARLLALSRTAAKVQSVLEPHRVFETMGNELRDLGLSCFFGLLSDPGDTVRLRYTNFSPEVQKAMEALRRGSMSLFVSWFCAMIASCVPGCTYPVIIPDWVTFSNR